MGDRRMAEIRTDGGSFYVYTHSGGYEFAEVARRALEAAAPRRGDLTYAARIVVDQLTAAGRDQELGYGLLLAPDAEDEYSSDNSPSIVIDLHEWTVTDRSMAEAL